MQVHQNEFPTHPLPHIPQPQQPQAHLPTVYVYERQRWEYRVVSKDVADEAPFSEDELNALGRNGWELVGVAPLANRVQFYFKRVRS